MPHDLDVTPEIADLLSPENLDQLAREAAVSYECWVCMQPGKLPDVPASVIILRDGPVDIAKLVHRFCGRSGLIEVPGLTAVMYEPSATRETSVTAVAAFLPNRAGHRPVLLVEFRSTVITKSGHHERVDTMANWLLHHGLHLVATTGGEVAMAPGWTVHLRGSTGIRVTGPVGWLYDGHLQVAPAWRNEATAQGRCLLLVGGGMSLDQMGQDPQGMQEAIGRVDAGAQRGRLAGGLVAIDVT